MRRRIFRGIVRSVGALACLAILSAVAVAADPVSVDLSGYRDDGGVAVRRDGGRLTVDWPIAGGEDENGRLVLDLRPGGPLIEGLGFSTGAPVLKALDPAFFLTVGSRVAPAGRPPSMSPFNTFFDAPAKRPHQSFRAGLDLRRARVTGSGRRARVELGDVAAGPFAGELHLTFYAGSRLFQVEAVLSTRQEDRAYLYDAGLVSTSPNWQRIGWRDTEGRSRRDDFAPDAADRPLVVRHRTIVAESDDGSVACFPPPHRYFFPRDLTDNLGYVWSGRDHRGLEPRPGFGIRQAETGGGSFVPWFNAPPGTEQRLGVFFLLARGRAEDASKEALRYTHGDRFPDLSGHRTFSSHWHMATAVAAMQEQARGAGRTTPDFVRMFKDMNVDIVHLAEFHGDGHPQDPGPLRLAELEAMFAECRRVSDDELLILPGEEANVHLGIRKPGQHPGHWLYLFPRPVYWTMQRAQGQPFAEDDPRLGTIYHVGDATDMLRLLERERGLAWTAHPRIKASSWAPDAYRGEDYYQSDRWLGAAWKAMPADLSRPELGKRSLDLLDEMANWGGRKYMPGEVDVFKLDHTHELYGHMNVNYLRLDAIPRFDDGWQPVLDALRGGRFFVTTGEVLLREFTVGGKPSGETLEVGQGGRPAIKLDLEWTFPMQFIEVVSGDGERTFRDRTDLADTGPFGRRTLDLAPDLAGRRWARVEAWDIAGNGAFTQPVWLAPGPRTLGR